MKPAADGHSQLDTTPAIRSRMRRQRTRSTGPEVELRKSLHRLRVGYRVQTRPLAGFRRVADIVFLRARVAVFVDGCFWHGCPDHGTWPASNSDFWKSKIVGNRERDRETDSTLTSAGWLAVRVWEHEDPDVAAVSIRDAVRRRMEPESKR